MSQKERKKKVEYKDTAGGRRVICSVLAVSYRHGAFSDRLSPYFGVRQNGIVFVYASQDGSYIGYALDLVRPYKYTRILQTTLAFSDCYRGVDNATGVAEVTCLSLLCTRGVRGYSRPRLLLATARARGIYNATATDRWPAYRWPVTRSGGFRYTTLDNVPDEEQDFMVSS